MHRTDHRETDPHVLAGRLATGWIMCDQERDPVRKQRLEGHWLRLLHEYEAACGVDMRNRREPIPEFSDHLKEAEGGRPSMIDSRPEQKPDVRFPASEEP